MVAVRSALFIAVAICVFCGCAGGNGAPRAAPPDQKALETQLRGLTLRKAVQQLGLKPEDCELFDEPPGVARGISAKLPDGRTIHLWLARQDGLFRENRDWTFQQIAERRVSAVKVEDTR